MNNQQLTPEQNYQVLLDALKYTSDIVVTLTEKNTINESKISTLEKILQEQKNLLNKSNKLIEELEKKLSHVEKNIIMDSIAPENLHEYQIILPKKCDCTHFCRRGWIMYCDDYANEKQLDPLPEFELKKDIFDTLSSLLEPKQYPIGGFAPGSYWCNCVTCKEKFMGDKKAVQCEPCAIEMVNIKVKINEQGGIESVKEEHKQDSVFSQLEVGEEYDREVHELGEEESKCQCIRPDDNTCDYCDNKESKAILGEAKQETLKDIAINYSSYNEQINKAVQEAVIFGAEWQAKRMYSEEDMIEFNEWVSLNFPNQHNYLRALQKYNQGLDVPKEHLVGYCSTKELLEKFKKK